MQSTQKRYSLINTTFNKVRALTWIPEGKDVHVQKLLKENPKIRDSRSLKDLINAQEGKYTLKEMGEIFYDNQELILTNKEFSLKQCIDYVEELYTKKSIDGRNAEAKALIWLRCLDKRFKWQEADNELDVYKNVDIIGENEHGKVYIQVKPETYKGGDQEVIDINKGKEERLGAKVHYIYYDTNFYFTFT